MERLLCSYEVRDSCLLTSAHDAGFFVHDLVVSCIASGKLFNMRDSLSSYAPSVVVGTAVFWAVGLCVFCGDYCAPSADVAADL